VADVELQPASDLSDQDVAALFTASYEGYLVPFAVDAAAVRSLTETCDLDRAASVIAVRDGERVGLANLGLRGREAWVGGRVSVVEIAGDEAPLRQLLEAVRRLGDTVSLLNLPAGHPASTALAALGGTVDVRQHEMVLQL
jgi:hypothetical protein